MPESILEISAQLMIKLFSNCWGWGGGVRRFWVSILTTATPPVNGLQQIFTKVFSSPNYQVVEISGQC